LAELINVKTAYLIVMLAIFCLPWLVWRLGRTDAIAPLVVVQIFGGVVMGPALALPAPCGPTLIRRCLSRPWCTT
jgi:predicted membrane protein